MAIISEEMSSVWELIHLLHVGSCNHHYDLRTIIRGLVRGLVCKILSENTSLLTHPDPVSIPMDITFLWCFNIVFTQSHVRIRFGCCQVNLWVIYFLLRKFEMDSQGWYAEYNMLHAIHKNNGHICCPWNTIWVWKGLKIIIRYSHWSYLTAGMSYIIYYWMNIALLYRCLIAEFV